MSSVPATPQPDYQSRRVIRVAIAGIGNCAGSLVQGVSFYRTNPDCITGLLFPSLAGYAVSDIQFVAGLDISKDKVGKRLSDALRASPNNFVEIAGASAHCDAPVFRAPTFDGNPPDLAEFVQESPAPSEDVAAILKRTFTDVLLNLIPTGSVEASEFYARAALEAGCAFVNCIPSVLAQREDLSTLFKKRGLPLLGDDIKSQVGTTILHRALLHMLESRGAHLRSTSQINIGGNTDFANFVHRAETKLISKRKSLARYTDESASHVGHHFDPNRGPYKHAIIDIDAEVFGKSSVKISVRLESDDKPNCAGSLVDLIRIAKGAMERGIGGPIPEVCAYYCKSPPCPLDDAVAFELVKKNWTRPLAVHDGTGVNSSR
jgi:myo-inositol-1-phosphate synthase